MMNHTNAINVDEERLKRIPQYVVDQANGNDIRELASRYVELSKASGSELKGPCPRCGGTDRFYVNRDYFGCRKCPQHKTRGAIRFMQWVEACGFREAVGMLVGDHPHSSKPKVTPVEKLDVKVKELSWRKDAWQRKAAVVWQSAHNRLLNASAGQIGRDYLARRGLEREAQQTFKLGFVEAVSIPGTQGRQKAPAIAMPWIVGGTLRGIRYRFLDQHNVNGKPVKQSAFYGSQFGATLYGGHALQEGVARLRTLVIVEGELNAISIWQVARNTNLDVLSLGSESARFTPVMVARASEYRRVIAWLDRAEVAKARIEEIAGAYGLRSPNDQDANDLLQAGLLGGFLSTVRLKVAERAEERQALLWDLWDGVSGRDNIDTGIMQVVQKLGTEFKVDL